MRRIGILTLVLTLSMLRPEKSKGQENRDLQDILKESKTISRELKTEPTELTGTTKVKDKLGKSNKVLVYYTKLELTAPEPWAVSEKNEMKFFIKKLYYPSLKVREIHEELVDKIGRNTFFLRKYREPFKEFNPTISIEWSPLPNIYKGASYGGSRDYGKGILEKSIIPRFKELDEDVEVLQEPRDVEGEPMVFTTLNHTRKYKDGDYIGVISRVYVLIKGDYSFTIILEMQELEDSATKKEIWDIFKSIETKS
jgi:hypothetical protein